MPYHVSCFSFLLSCKESVCPYSNMSPGGFGDSSGKNISVRRGGLTQVCPASQAKSQGRRLKTPNVMPVPRQKLLCRGTCPSTPLPWGPNSAHPVHHPHNLSWGWHSEPGEASAVEGRPCTFGSSDSRAEPDPIPGEPLALHG